MKNICDGSRLNTSVLPNLITFKGVEAAQLQQINECAELCNVSNSMLIGKGGLTVLIKGSARAVRAFLMFLQA
jgi:hypothetical protein